MSISPIAWRISAATARAARAATRGRWRSALGGGCAQSPAAQARDARRAVRRRRSSSPRLSRTGSRKTAAAGRARSCSPMAAARNVDRPRRWRASLSSRSPRLTGSAAQAASCWRRRSRWPRSKRASPTASRARDEVTFDRASASLRARRARRLGAIALTEQPCRSRQTKRPRACSRKASRGSASTSCLGPKRCGNGATASCSCAGRRRRVAGPVGCGARRDIADWLARRSTGKTASG